MALEQTLKVENNADRALQKEIEAVQAEFDAEMRKVFGMKLPNPAVATCEPNHGSIDTELILELMKKAKDTLVAYQQLLRKSDKVTQAMEIDMSLGDGRITITDLERAIEFLDEANPRKNSETFRRVWDYLIAEATVSVEDLSPMPYKKPNMLFPRTTSLTPIFGFTDRDVWQKQKDFLHKKTQERIGKVNFFVNDHYLKIDERPQRQSA